MAKICLNLKDTDYGVSVNIGCDTDPNVEVTPAMMMASAIAEFVAHLNAESHSNAVYVSSAGEVRSH